ASMDDLDNLRNDLQSTLNSYDEKINGINEQVSTAVESELSAITADLKYFNSQLEELKAKNDEINNKINSIESKLNSLGDKADKSEVNSLQNELNSTKTELSSLKAMAQETTDAFNAYQAKLIAEEEERKNNPLAGLFNLGGNGVLPIILGLLVLATIGLIIFGYMKKEDWLPKNEEGNGMLTFLNKDEEKKKLKEFKEEDDLQEDKKGKWAVE
ncbi:MAG: hypothetical protein JW703_01825, partial [Candidatus Diapherotrites archaeon]|nr:hypothetical protein [Candidatus Diapherotrites archaeon]